MDDPSSTLPRPGRGKNSTVANLRTSTVLIPSLLSKSFVTLIPKASIDVVPQEGVDHGVPEDLVGVLRSIVVWGSVTGSEGIWAHPGLDAGAAPVGGDQAEHPPAVFERYTNFLA